MAMYENVFERSKNLKTRFSAIWRTKDGEILNVRGVIKRLAGDVYGISDVEVTLQSGKPAHRAVAEKFFTASSQAGVVAKLREHFSRVDVTHDTDPLKLEMERDQRQRNLESAHTERTVSQAPAPAGPKLIFGLEVGDPKLGQIFAAACEDWVQRHAVEFNTTGVSEAEAAAMVANMEVNSRSIARLVEKWALEGKIKVLTHQEVQDARAWLEQRGYWIPLRRQRGVPAGREYFPEPTSVAEKAVERDPRKMSFEELQKIERERQARVKREKGLRDDINSLGSVR